MNELTIVIISYNTKQLTLDCLQSIYEQTQQVSYHIIVVDNNSSDGSAAGTLEKKKNMAKQRF